VAGHQILLGIGEDRLFLRCQNCPYESPGWVVAPRSKPEPPLVLVVGRREITRPNDPPFRVTALDALILQDLDRKQWWKSTH
jgi:hypothetical protein